MFFFIILKIFSDLKCEFEWLPVNEYVFVTVYITQDEAAFRKVIIMKFTRWLKYKLIVGININLPMIEIQIESIFVFYLKLRLIFIF